MAKDALPLLTFVDAASLEWWLSEHGATSLGAWLRFAKQGALEPTVSKSDAIDGARIDTKTAGAPELTRRALG